MTPEELDRLLQETKISAAREEAMRCLVDIRAAWTGRPDDDRPAIAAIQKRNGFKVTVSPPASDFPSPEAYRAARAKMLKEQA